MSDYMAFAQMKKDSLSIRKTCTWKYECPYEIGYYDTECGTAYYFEEGTIEENDYRFCPYCGKRIVEEGTKE